MKPTWQVRIVAGRRRGTRVPLGAGESVVLGRALDADVVLREPGLADRALRLNMSDVGNELTVDVLADGVRADDEPVADGERIAPASGARLAIGSLVLVLEEIPASLSEVVDAMTASSSSDAFDAEGFDHAEAAGGAPADRSANAAAALAADGGASAGQATGGRADVVRPDILTEDVPTVPAPVPSTAPARRSFVSLGSIIVFACLSVAGWLWYAGDGEARGPRLDARLEADFPTLSLEQGPGGTSVVRGFVSTRADAIRLEQWLDAQPEPASNGTLVDTDLAERVADVFRISGVEATVTTLVDGAAEVATRADPDTLDALSERVREDVPQLVSLVLDNTPPAPPEDDMRTDPGKRVELVVATDPAYVVTRDRSRYFIGALLPSGHRIADIEEGVVHLVKNDVATELKF